MFPLDYYKIVRVPTSRGRDAIFIGRRPRKYFSAKNHRPSSRHPFLQPLRCFACSIRSAVLPFVSSIVFVLKFVKIKSHSMLANSNLRFHGRERASNGSIEHRSISSRRKGLDELSIVYEEGGIKIDSHRVETLAEESSRGKFLLPETRHRCVHIQYRYPHRGDNCQRFHARARERERKKNRWSSPEVYRRCTRDVARFRWKICTDECVSRLPRRRISGNGGQLVVLKDSGARPLALPLARSAGNRSICEVPPETARSELCPSYS